MMERDAHKPINGFSNIEKDSIQQALFSISVK
jgi:hypothetical protein